jgi:hypothetical protein
MGKTFEVKVRKAIDVAHSLHVGKDDMASSTEVVVKRRQFDLQLGQGHRGGALQLQERLTHF